MRARRHIVSKRVYEICFRARAGLPLVARMIIRFVIGAAIARTQRDDKVILCHDIWNGSHSHQIIVTRDSKKCVSYYGEIQKRITDILKRLLGLKYLDIWEGHVTVAEILDQDEVITRISYLYANPAQDNLEDSIDTFPGFSSWRDFKKSINDLDAEEKEEFPWIRLPSIPQLSSANPSFNEELRVISELKRNNKHKHNLIRRPNEWMRCFGIKSGDETTRVNEKIVQRLRERESAARDKRLLNKKVVLGAHKLRTQEILKAHRPKKKERKIYVLSSCKTLRLAFIKAFETFCDRCQQCYLSLLKGELYVKWPPGAFRPPLPPNLNVLPDSM